MSRARFDVIRPSHRGQNKCFPMQSGEQNYVIKKIEKRLSVAERNVKGRQCFCCIRSQVFEKGQSNTAFYCVLTTGVVGIFILNSTFY